MKTSGIIVAVICIVLLDGAATKVEAQDKTSPQAFSSLKPWKTTDETTFAAAIQEVVAKNPTGAPAGLNLLMTGSQQPLYVNVGPHLKQSLTVGQVIRVTGIVQNFNGQNYLLARELQIGDQKIEVRNEHGFFTYPSAGSRSARPPSAGNETSKFGGVR